MVFEFQTLEFYWALYEKNVINTKEKETNLKKFGDKSNDLGHLILSPAISTFSRLLMPDFFGFNV